MDLNKLHAKNGKIYGKGMTRKDKYGRGSAAANGEGFVDLAPGDGLRLYAIEALDITRGERLEVHLAVEPRQFKTSRLLLMGRISYYVGDVNRTHPKFLFRAESFTIERMAELLYDVMQDMISRRQPPTINHYESSPLEALVIQVL